MYGIKKGEKYPEAVRKFAFALNYHSRSAYEIVRKQFNYHLPHPRTLKKWLKNSDLNGEPGIREETLQRLKKFVDDLQEKGEELICTLTLDEMYIRKQLYYDQHSFQYVGYPTYPPSSSSEFSCFDDMKKQSDINETQNNETSDGVDENNSSKKKNQSLLATRALVFLLSGINKKFYFPVCYHFVKGINSRNLSKLTKDVIMKVSEQGIIISNLTFDGAKVNFGMCKMLGANLNASSDEFKPYITNPFDKSRIIYLIADPSYVLKLMRNLLGNHKILLDDNENQIKWSYYVDLQEISTKGDLLTHKLTKKHTHEWERNKMNVRLASQTYSGSVANSMKLLRISKDPKFEHSEPTERFTDIMDKTFDIFNSFNPRHSNPYKRALNAENRDEIFEFIEKVMPYFKSLKMIQTKQIDDIEIESKVHVLETAHHTPVLGFLMNLWNLPRIYRTYVIEDERDERVPAVETIKTMKYLRTCAFSQDHLELLFAKIRLNNGHNDNPNIMQFKGSYRKLLSNVEIKPPESANCMVIDGCNTDIDTFGSLDIPHSNVFTVSSEASSHVSASNDIVSDPIFLKNLSQFNEVNSFQILLEPEEISDLQAMEANEHLFDGLKDISIAYAASLIEERFESRYIYCACCSDVFLKNKKLNDRKLGIVCKKSPCASTYYICKIADQYFSAYKPDKKKQFDYRVLYYKIFEDIEYEKIYTESNFKDHEVHRFHLVKFIVKCFLQIKTKQISKEITYNEYQKIIRSKLTKWIHFSGQ